MKNDLGGVVTDHGLGFSVIGDSEYWHAKFFFKHIGNVEEEDVLLWEVAYDLKEMYAKKMKETLQTCLEKKYDYQRLVAKARHLAQEIRPKLEQLSRLLAEDKDHPEAGRLKGYIDGLFAK